MSLKRNFSKKAALELSMSTVVIIVLGVIMLILGIVLIRSISEGATDSIDKINDMTSQKLSSLFGEDEGNIATSLGPQNTARIKAGTDSFGFVIRASTEDGSAVTRERLKYKLTLDKSGSKNCASSSYLGEKRTEALFITLLNVETGGWDRFEGSDVHEIIQLSIPKGTPTCTQKVYIDVTDTETGKPVGGNFFVIEIIKARTLGIF